MLIEFKISVEEFRTGAEKYKYIFSLSKSLVACTVLVSLLSWSSSSGTRVLMLTKTFLLSVIMVAIEEIKFWTLKTNQICSIVLFTYI